MRPSESDTIKAVPKIQGASRYASWERGAELDPNTCFFVGPCDSPTHAVSGVKLPRPTAADDMWAALPPGRGRRGPCMGPGGVPGLSVLRTHGHWGPAQTPGKHMALRTPTQRQQRQMREHSSEHASSLHPTAVSGAGHVRVHYVRADASCWPGSATGRPLRCSGEAAFVSLNGR